MVPEWQLEEWRNLTVEKLRSMTHPEILSLLRKALKSTTELSEGPEKNLVMRLGKCAIQIENLAFKTDELGDSEEADQLKAEGRKIFDEEVIPILMKLMILRQADSIRDEEKLKVVEITEELGEDPWDGKYCPKEVIPEEQKEEINQVGDFDPWKDEL